MGINIYNIIIIVLKNHLDKKKTKLDSWYRSRSIQILYRYDNPKNQEHR